MIKNLQYDTFYHEHLRTYSALALKKLFEYYKLCFFNAYKVTRYGGSLRCFVSNNKHNITNSLKQIYKKEKKEFFNEKVFTTFSKRIYNSSNVLQDKIMKFQSKGYHIVGKACPARAIVLLSFNNLNYKKISYIAEQETSLKLDLTIPFLNIPIKNSIIFFKDKPDYILL